MATKTFPFGTKLQYDADGTPAYTDLVDLISVSGPNMTIGDSEETTLESANAAREYGAGWIDGGEVSFTVYMTKAQLATLISTIAYGRTTYYWKIMMPLISAEANNTNYAFQGYIKGYNQEEITISGEDKIRTSFTIKVTGRPTFTAGT